MSKGLFLNIICPHLEIARFIGLQINIFYKHDEIPGKVRRARLVKDGSDGLFNPYFHYFR